MRLRLYDFGPGHTEEGSNSDQPPGSEQSQSDQNTPAHDSGDEASPETDPEAVEQPTTTTRWTPDGEACERCGRVRKRCWRGDGAFVCADCKKW